MLYKFNLLAAVFFYIYISWRDPKMVYHSGSRLWKSSGFLLLPYETSSAAAALQNDFKKRYKRAAKGLAAAVAKNGCFALQWKPFDSDKQRCCSGAENSRITICAAKWLRILRQRILFPVMAYHSLVQRKRNADFNNTITTKHGRGDDQALGGVKTTRKSKCN